MKDYAIKLSMIRQTQLDRGLAEEKKLKDSPNVDHKYKESLVK